MGGKILGVLILISFANGETRATCDVRAWTEAGWVCGLRRWSANGQVYASFRGVPYAKQPIGELRFRELQPPAPWKHNYDAREEGPICPQHNALSGYTNDPEYSMSEACIHANIHVPIYALPKIENKEKITIVLPEKQTDNGRTGIPFPFKSSPYENQDDQEKVINDLIELHKQRKVNLFKSSKLYNNVDRLVFEYQNEGMKGSNYQEDKGKILIDDRKEESDKDKDRRYTLIDQYSSEPMFFWSSFEKPESSKRVRRILDPWSAIQPNYVEKELRPFLYRDKRADEDEKKPDQEEKLLPILVFIHGGNFGSGSGGAGLHGPEYLVSKDVIVITFNYRLNVFGFLSLNHSTVPGNNGLRDQITLLRWVQRNAKNFGGDPDNVTLMGVSAGATSAHLLSLSDAAKGLFQRLWLMSGVGYQGYYTTSPFYAAAVTADFLAILGITSKDPQEIHKELIKMPLKRLIEANSLLQSQADLSCWTFGPVVETKFPGVATVIDKDPETLIAEGRGREYPMVIGHTASEAEKFREKLSSKHDVSRIIANPRLILPAGIIFSTSSEVSLVLSEKAKERYFEKEPNMDGIIKSLSEGGYIYPAIRLARERATLDAAPTYLYLFSFEGELAAAHRKDLTYVFRDNSLLAPKSDFPPTLRDDMMRDWMSVLVVNFMHCSEPTCSEKDLKSGWPQVSKDRLVYQNIGAPYVYKVMTPTHKLLDIIRFYDEIYAMSRLDSANVTSSLK